MADPERHELVLPGDELVRRLLANMLPHDGKLNRTRAALLQELCALGSTSARLTCRYFGFAPDERVRLRGRRHG